MSINSVALVPSLLIIEDDIPIREMIFDIFEDAPVQKYVAGDGIEALKLIDEGKILDTILCDINMPNMDGLEFLEQLRKRGVDTPLIFLTGEDDPSLIIRALQNGVFDFLYKSSDLKRLYSVVVSAIEVGLRLRVLKQNLLISPAFTKLNFNEQEIKRKIIMMMAFLESRKKSS